MHTWHYNIYFIQRKKLNYFFYINLVREGERGEERGIGRERERERLYIISGGEEGMRELPNNEVNQ